jgi:tetratricopeptide repeat protein
MSDGVTEGQNGTCFVVMGFGKKTDFETGNSFDLDKSYKNMIKPAVIAAGLKCIRADEIVHSGLIDVPMYDQLLKADVVVADLSTSNKNAFYELGVRHALRPFTTVVISEDGMKAPFDVNHVVVRKYHHLGSDIGFDEVMRFRAELTDAIRQVLAKDPRDSDSPVYAFIKDLRPPAIEAAVQAMAAGARAASARNEDPASVADAGVAAAHSILMQQVEDAQKEAARLTKEDMFREAREALRRAKSLLETVRKMRKETSTPAGEPVEEKPEDPYIVQRLALLTYKSKDPYEAAALEEASKLLSTLAPQTSNDTETLGLWGAIHKRIYSLNKDRNALDESVRAYERGFYLRNDYYNGINFAFMLNIRAAQAADSAEAIADFVQARRVRKEVLTICEEWLAANKPPGGEGVAENAMKQYQENQYWVLATMAEAHIGLEDETRGGARLAEAFALAPADWMKQSTTAQLAELRALLAVSPLNRISTR